MCASWHDGDRVSNAEIDRMEFHQSKKNNQGPLTPHSLSTPHIGSKCEFSRRELAVMSGMISHARNAIYVISENIPGRAMGWPPANKNNIDISDWQLRKLKVSIKYFKYFPDQDEYNIENHWL